MQYENALISLSLRFKQFTHHNPDNANDPNRNPKDKFSGVNNVDKDILKKRQNFLDIFVKFLQWQKW